MWSPAYIDQIYPELLYTSKARRCTDVNLELPDDWRRQNLQVVAKYRDSISFYTENFFVNNDLRKGYFRSEKTSIENPEEVFPPFKSLAVDLVNAFKEATPLPYDIWLYRTRFRDVAKDPSETASENKGFSSFSFSMFASFYFGFGTLYIVKVPKGTPVLYIPPELSAPKADGKEWIVCEFLLPPSCTIHYERVYSFKEFFGRDPINTCGKNKTYAELVSAEFGDLGCDSTNVSNEPKTIVVGRLTLDEPIDEMLVRIEHMPIYSDAELRARGLKKAKKLMPVKTRIHGRDREIELNVVVDVGSFKRDAAIYRIAVEDSGQGNSSFNSFQPSANSFIPLQQGQPNTNSFIPLQQRRTNLFDPFILHSAVISDQTRIIEIDDDSTARITAENPDSIIYNVKELLGRNWILIDSDNPIGPGLKKFWLDSVDTSDGVKIFKLIFAPSEIKREMARFLPNQLKFDLLKFQDASVLNTVLPQLNKPYYWRQLIADNDFYRDPRSRAITYGVDIKGQMITGVQSSVILALMGKRLDSIAAKMLNPFATIFLMYRDRPDLFQSIGVVALRRQTLTGDQRFDPFLLPSLINFFRIISFQQLYTIFIGQVDKMGYSILEKEGHFSNRLGDFLAYIIVSGNEGLCEAVISWPLQNGKSELARTFRGLIIEYSRKHQIANILYLAENYSYKDMEPKQLPAGHDREIVRKYVNQPEYRAYAYNILMKKVLGHMYDDFDNFLSDNIVDYYYVVVFTMTVLGLYSERLDKLAVKAGNTGNLNVNSINLFESLQYLIRHYNLMPNEIIARELPANWEQLAKTTNAVHEPFMLIIGAANDVEKMKRLIAIGGSGIHGASSLYFRNHWYQFGLEVYNYLVTLFDRPPQLDYRTPVLFETKVETVAKWATELNIMVMELDPLLPVKLVRKLQPNALRISHSVNRYSEELSTMLIIPDISSLLPTGLTPIRHELNNLSFYLRAEIFAQLPKEYKAVVLKIIEERCSATKIAFFRTL